MSYPDTKTFWMDPSGQTARGLRRYSTEHRKSGGGWDCTNGYHSAINWVDRVPTKTYQDTDGCRMRKEVPQFSKTDPRWPLVCDSCAYLFVNTDPKQTFSDEIYRRADTGAEHVLPLRKPGPQDAPAAPAGAMWHSYWLPSGWRGDDGIALTVCLPDGTDWMVDSRARNCDQPNRPHKCWVRHGDPRQGHVTVDKNGDTCGAGGGSIASSGYHGFLRAGVLTAG